MKLSRVITLGLSISAILFLSGCALKSAPQPDLIHTFEMQEPKAKTDETVVYVINTGPTLMRLNSTIGINNDNYHIKNGSYNRVILRDKINNISMIPPADSTYPIDYLKVDNRKGEVIFLTFKHSFANDKTLKEIDKESGMTLVMQAEKQNEPKNMPVYGHQIALINPAFVDIKLMKKVESKSNIEAGKARIVFYRTENTDYWRSKELGIWSKNSFVGGLKGNESLSIDIEAGRHEFATQYGAWGILDVNLKAGKTYYVEVFTKIGWDEIYTKLIAKKSTTSIEEIKQQMSNFTEVTLDKSKIDPNIQLRLDTALPYVKNALENRNSVSVEYTDKLDSSDGR